MDQRHNRTHGELPFKAQPDIDEDCEGRAPDRKNGRPDQLSGHFRANGFDRWEGDRGVDLLQGRLGRLNDLGCDGFVAVLRLNPDHRHVLVRPEGRVKHFGDRHVAQVQRHEGSAISADIDPRRAFRADRRAAAEIDAEIQPHDRDDDHRGNHRHDRGAKGRLRIAKEVDVGCIWNQS